MPPPDARRLIRQGSTGRDVAYAQERLNAHGATLPLVVDSIFGPLTREAAIKYQKSHGLVPNAIIGPRTWASLDGPATLGGSSGAGPGGGAGGPDSQIIQYDTGSQTFAVPAPGTKMSDIRDQIKAKQDKKPEPDLGKTVSAKGVAQRGDEEVFVGTSCCTWPSAGFGAARSTWSLPLARHQKVVAQLRSAKSQCRSTARATPSSN